MGSKSSKLKPKLTQDQIRQYETDTLFTSHEIIQLHQSFRKYCAEDGGVDRESFTDMFSTFNKSAKALMFMDHIFRCWDSNRDGNLTFREFVHALSVTSRGSRKERAEWLFHVYDINKDGTITIEEFRSIMKLRLRKTQLGELERIFNQIDDNNDGFLTIDEFASECVVNDTLMDYLDIY